MRSATAPAVLLDLTAAGALLDRAVALLDPLLRQVRPIDLTRPTPCARWDVGWLITHLQDAVAAVAEAASGEVRVEPRLVARPEPVGVADAARALLEQWRADAAGSPVVVGTAHLTPGVLLGAAALEIAVHADDLAVALGRPGMDDALALTLWPVARALVRTGDRAGRFGAPVEVPPGSPPRMALRAHLGRRPG